MIRILLVDDHTLVRHGLRRLLNDCNDMQVIGEAGGGHEALRLARELRPDVMLMDLSMPELDGSEATKRLRGEGLKARVLIVTAHASAVYAMRLLEAGAHGFVSKSAPSDDVIAAIRKVAGGGRYLPPALAEELPLYHAREDESQSPVAALTDREVQVLKRLAEGAKCRAIALELHLSVKTVDSYRGRLLEKLQLDTTADLVRFALHHGVIADTW
jgi:DNA-binding NarL/FixJ family response regulator